MKRIASVLALAGSCVLATSVAPSPALALETYEAKMEASEAASQAAFDMFEAFGFKQLRPGQYLWRDVPESAGRERVVISLTDQLAFLYRGNTLVAVAKGMPKGYLGVGDFDRTQVPGSNTYGVKIDDLRHNRPADLAGLRDGDIVTEFDTVPIRTSDELISRIKRATPGSTVKVVVVREGQRMEIPVKMGQDD